MKILMCHTRYQIRGGEDESVDVEVGLLRSAGHDVDLLEDDNHRIDKMSQLAVARDAIWSPSAAHRIRQVLAGKKYDLVHVQNFFPLLSPSIHYTAKAAGVPVVQSLRNYRLGCLNGMFFRAGEACEDCLTGHTFWPGIKNKCYRDSMPASLVLTTSLLAHRGLRTWSRQVDAYIAPSKFTRDKMIEIGLPPVKIHTKPNTISTEEPPGKGRGGFALFVGRLAPEKGISTLLQCWRDNPSVPLKIIGDGPLSELVRQETQINKNIIFIGRKPLPEVYKLMGDAMMVVVPSIGYETFGRVVVESYARGTPVVSSDAGSLTELVEHGRTGLLVRPSDAPALANAVNSLAADHNRLRSMRMNARNAYEKHYRPSENVRILESIYRETLPHSSWDSGASL